MTTVRYAFVLCLAFACACKKDEPAPDKAPPASDDGDVVRLERMAAELDTAITDLNGRLDAALKELEAASSDADRERLRAAVDKLVAEKATLDKRVEALDAAVKARAAKR